MSSTQEKPLDLSGLTNDYDILGELAAGNHTRHYPARRTTDGKEVLITVLRAAPDMAQGKAIAQFAADANLMTRIGHPNVPRVLEARWIGDDAFAIVADRIQGQTLAEQLKGERLTKPRIAAILGDVDGVLSWARGERLSHRNVTPESVWIERGTGKVFVLPAPTDAPKTNRPDPRDDARTIGQLAMAMLTAKPMTDEHDGTLISMRPDLPQRVADATEKVANCTLNDELPDVPAYLASLAMADAIKEGEVEVARVEAEFRAQMKAEREKWESEQEACRLANEAQAKKFADERAEYERRSAKEREQLVAARAEVEKRKNELQQARAELDQARAAQKQKKSELDARSRQLDRQMSDLEKQKRALEKRALELSRRAEELEARNKELTALAALAAAGGAAVNTPDEEGIPAGPSLEERIEHVGEITRPTQQVAIIDDDDVEPVPDEGEVIQDAVDADEEVHAWMPLESDEPWKESLETDEPVQALRYEAAAIPDRDRKKRPAWMIPAGLAGLGLILAGSVYAIQRQSSDDTPTSVVARSAQAPTQRPVSSPAPTGITVDSAAGSVAVLSDSTRFIAIRDSIAAADEARRIRRERAAAQAAAEAAAARTQPRTYTDSDGRVWYYERPPATSQPPGSSTQLPPVSRPDSVAPAPRPDSALRVALPKLDSLAKPKLDSLVRPRPDTGVRVRPDTVRCCSI